MLASQFHEAAKHLGGAHLFAIAAIYAGQQRFGEVVDRFLAVVGTNEFGDADFARIDRLSPEHKRLLQAYTATSKELGRYIDSTSLNARDKARAHLVDVGSFGDYRLFREGPG